jgi:NADH dehydrogenase
LETAALQADDFARRQLLTFVIAGGGFAGVETTGAVNDFIHETARYYPSIANEEIRVVLIHPDSFLLPELGEELGLYAARKLRERKVDVVKGVRVASYDGSIVTLTDGMAIPATTLIWTAGVKPSAVIASLPCEKERGRVRVNEYLAVPAVSGLWAAGDCAWPRCSSPRVASASTSPPTSSPFMPTAARR